MKTIKVSEATPLQLNWLVAKCEGVPVDDPEQLVAGGWVEFDEFDNPSWAGHEYSTDWSQGGPIIEREKIDVTESNGWWAAYNGEFGYGPTPLIAAMCCFVASRLDYEVEIPDELL